MKKGFTIVELAIVLVVIGIILGMAVKGKALVDAARMRSEVAKMNKFEAAAYIYYADTNYMPTVPSTSTGVGYLGFAQFVDKELLTNGDRDEKIGGNAWGLFLCNPLNQNPATYWVPDANGGNICVTGITNTDANITSGATTAAIPGRLACNIEIMKDDENATNGEGRGWNTLIAHDTGNGAPSPTSMPVAAYRNCDNYSTGTSIAYGYRVF